MSLDTAIARFRQREVDLMRDKCTIRRADGAPSFDPNSGTYTAPTSVVYTGSCTLRPVARRGGGSDLDTNQQQLREYDYLARLPVDTDVRENDILDISCSTYDTGLVDATFTVVDVPLDGQQICRLAGLVRIVGEAASSEVGS